MNYESGEAPQQAADKPQRTRGGRIAMIAGIVLCAVLLPGFIVSLTLLINSLIHPGTPPDFMGYTPLIVESDSMKPFFQKNDLLIVRSAPKDEAYRKGEVICFKSEGVYITHRIVEVSREGDDTVYTTQGDANNTPDTDSVRPNQIVGVYRSHIKGLGGFVLYIQTPQGMVLCVMLPVFLIFGLFSAVPRMADRLSCRKKSEKISD